MKKDFKGKTLPDFFSPQPNRAAVRPHGVGTYGMTGTHARSVSDFATKPMGSQARTTGAQCAQSFQFFSDITNPRHVTSGS